MKLLLDTIKMTIVTLLEWNRCMNIWLRDQLRRRGSPHTGCPGVRYTHQTEQQKPNRLAGYE